MGLSYFTDGETTEVPSFIDLTGKRFGRLLVEGRAADGKWKQPKWHCVCDCGGRTVAFGNSLRGGKSTSCGCRQAEAARTHGESASDLHFLWRRIKQRCRDPKNNTWNRYGGRGITVYSGWIDDFVAFRDWILNELGPCPSDGHSLDRIDNNGHYEPGNVRWATRLEQGGNKANNVLITHNGETLTLSEWSRRTGMSATTIRGRLKRGWSEADALTTPPGPNGKPKPEQ